MHAKRKRAKFQFLLLKLWMKLKFLTEHCITSIRSSMNEQRQSPYNQITSTLLNVCALIVRYEYLGFEEKSARHRVQVDPILLLSIGKFFSLKEKL